LWGGLHNQNLPACLGRKVWGVEALKEGTVKTGPGEKQVPGDGKDQTVSEPLSKIAVSKTLVKKGSMGQTGEGGALTDLKNDGKKMQKPPNVKKKTEKYQSAKMLKAQHDSIGKNHGPRKQRNPGGWLLPFPTASKKKNSHTKKHRRMTRKVLKRRSGSGAFSTKNGGKKRGERNRGRNCTVRNWASS